MKFGQQQRSFLSQADNQAFQEFAIPYKDLKKDINLLTGQLKKLKLDVDNLQADAVAKHAEGNPAPQGWSVYYFIRDYTLSINLKLLAYHRAGDKEMVAGSLLPLEVRKIMLNVIAGEKASQELAQLDGHVSNLRNSFSSAGSTASALSSSYNAKDSSTVLEVGIGPHNDDIQEEVKGLTYQRFVLDAGAAFFTKLLGRISKFEQWQLQEKEKLELQIVKLKHDLVPLAAPKSKGSLFSKSDMYPWREILGHYLDANIFFSISEADAGERKHKEAKAQLIWFESKANDRQFLKSFRKRTSIAAVERFLKMNYALLHLVEHREWNVMAQKKILKKLDKRTSLDARAFLVETLSGDSFMAGELARAICAVIKTELLDVTPQLSDYECPVCATITFKPIRLRCQHVFCIRCMIVLQRDLKKFCPLCRQEVVMQADSTNLDMPRLEFLKKYFPREAAEKQQANEKALQKDMARMWAFP